MNVKLHPRGLAARTFAWGLALLLLTAAAAQAALPGQDRVPANALVALGIADTGKCCSKTSALALAKAINQYLDSPQVSDNISFQQYKLERDKLALALGYPATADEFMTNVFSSVLVYGLPPAQPQGKPVLTVVLGVKDKAKAESLVKTLDKRHTDMAAAKTTTTAEKTFTFEKITIAQTPVSHARVKGSGTDFEDAYYALGGDKFFFTNDAGMMGQLIEGKDKPAQTIDQNPSFSQLAGALPWKDADVAGWMDSGGLLTLLKNPALGSMINLGKAQAEKVAFTLNVEPDGIVGQVAGTPEETSLKPRQLQGMAYLSPEPLLAMVYGMLDPAKSYQELSGLISGLLLGAQMSAAGGAAGQISNPLTELEQSLGISFQNDLVPALGNEALVSINSLNINPLAGLAGLTVDLVVGVEVRDEAKMKALLAKFESTVESRLGGMAPAATDPNAPAAPPKFHAIPGGIRTFSTGSPMLSPSYALQGKYLLLSINAESLQAALGRAKNPQPAAVAEPAFAELAKLAGSDQIYSFTVMDVRQLAQKVLSPVMGIVLLSGGGKMPVEQQQMLMAVLTQVMPKIGTAAALETVQNGLARGYFKLKM